MTDLSILDTDVDSVTEPRRYPDGDYLAQAIGVEFDENSNNTKYADVELKLLEPMAGQDLTGVNRENTLNFRIWLSAKSLGIAKGELKKFGIEMTGNFKDLFERIPGSTVVVTVAPDDYAAKKGRDYAKVAAIRTA